MPEAVLIDAIRSPFGRRLGALRNIRPDALLAALVDRMLQRQPAARIDDLIVGCVSQAGEQGANIARQAALLSGLGEHVPGVTLNRMCGSSQQAVHFAAQAVAAGDAHYILAGGVESMSRVPMFTDLTLGRADFAGFDRLNPDLLARHPLIHQVESAERIAEHWNLDRQALDDYARASHARAWAAAQEGRHAELLPWRGEDADGRPIDLVRDEGIRPATDPARMAAMAPVFRPVGEGRITAANASQIADGAALVLVGDHEQALRDGLRPRARFRARVAIGSDPVMQLDGVIPATHGALRRSGLSIRDLDWIEINEAFASVVLAWGRAFPEGLEKANPWGGAIAHGHPLGATGAGLMGKMLCGLEATGGALGLQLMCIGHGMATATIIERL
ncbi:acetyl-CoA C-acyltransferase [Castellaniella ginsengisoli]|uniref:Thiolase family protein n=1 Tax=Castellaniella ginsengisoli TaxID=546114 RepID=A0AB39EQ40_9BURK